VTDGIFVLPDGQDDRDDNWVRPRSKKQVRELVEANPNRVKLEHTGVFREGPRIQLVTELDPCAEIYFVGPDPHRDRRFYGRVTTDLEGRARVI
jgi:hypothetical protein